MITPQTLAQILAQAEGFGSAEAAIAALRLRWPEIHFTTCAEDDIPPRLRPIARGEFYSLYPISNTQHCIGFAPSLEAATGLVLAISSEADPNDE